jgi:predicted nuclease of restriction endonuclease-like RecB superfamily
MLTADQSIIVYGRDGASPDKLTRRAHAHYLAYAERMLAAYGANVGHTRREAHRAVESILANEPDCNARRVAAFCKILDDAAEFEKDPHGEAAKLRLKVFSIAAKYHPLVTAADGMFDRTESEVKILIASELGSDWPAIDAALYADVIDQQRLLQPPAFTDPADLLSRYNVGQLQACLYRATQLSIDIATDFAAVVRRAKLCRLLLDIRRLDAARHRIDLSGPAAILRETRRYGIHFARFLPTLLACRGWSLQARLVTPWGGTAKLNLTSEDGYRSHLPPPAQFDSDVERQLAEAWGDSRAGWRLLRDAGILHEGQSTFVPDFLLRHDDGREAFLEIVGFWTPEYLAAKRKALAQFAGRKIVLAVARRTAKKEAGGPGVVIYKTRIKPDDVVAAVEALA